MRLVSNFVCCRSRALTKGLSTCSFEMISIVFAIREAIRYSGMVGVFNKERRIKVKSLSLFIIGKTSDVGE